MSTGVPRRVAYPHSDELLRVADCLPVNEGRASLVHALVDSYSLLTETAKEGYARVVEPLRATREQLVRFHDERFIGTSDAILGTEGAAGNSSDLDSEEESEDGARPPTPIFGLDRAPSSPHPRKRRKAEHGSSIGLQDDCPVFAELPDYVQLVAGASIQAARELRDGNADVAISWTGGRHHSKRAEAAGFCYVADAVLAIMELRSGPGPLRHSSPDLDTPPLPLPPPPARISRVLYLDLDLHHGDGVESAFFSTPHVLTLSMHLFAPLFFPASGALESTGPVGRGRAKPAAAGHALNVALEPGLGEETFMRVWESCIVKVASAYDADAIVLQLGVDGLAGDPCKEWNLSLSALGFALERVLSWNKRTLLLGGGGYDSPNAARAWTYLTSIAVGRPLALDAAIPADLPTAQYEQFAPSFSLDVPAGHVQDRNTDGSLARVEEAFERYARDLVAKKEAKSAKSTRSALQ
ncbi:hypothetical protein BMF94_1758 [Rhodotorula taiwanensis]|uniref:histone deacetylase n=1 Tax=Rhodotorula taiwanensis TaxID=741276 RepID=A0A2S5BEC5_9BASI|nr:hypothetical protein BMF94_1758 [Rhodotorula taiwanensis]